MNPGIVDVNVHPAKLEIKFSDERKIHSSVFWAVQNALLSSQKEKEADKEVEVEAETKPFVFEAPKPVENPAIAFSRQKDTVHFQPAPKNTEMFTKEFVEIFKKDENIINNILRDMQKLCNARQLSELNKLFKLLKLRFISKLELKLLINTTDVNAGQIYSFDYKRT